VRVKKERQQDREDSFKQLIKRRYGTIESPRMTDDYEALMVAIN